MNKIKRYFQESKEISERLKKLSGWKVLKINFLIAWKFMLGFILIKFFMVAMFIVALTYVTNIEFVIPSLIGVFVILIIGWSYIGITKIMSLDKYRKLLVKIENE